MVALALPKGKAAHVSSTLNSHLPPIAVPAMAR